MPTSTEVPPREAIFNNLTGKAVVKQQVFDVMVDTFNQIKEILHELCSDINDALPETLNRRVRLEYRDRGRFEAEIKIAGDVLVVGMHSNVFQFDDEHPIWKLPYVQRDAHNSYCGIISIYNFLSDSFKYNRSEDVGYLVGRIFINRDKCFFVDGKRQQRFRVNHFGENVLARADLVSIMETAMLYATEFDLLVPPYDTVKQATVEQINAKVENAKLPTGKRLGFPYCANDVPNVAE
ncbi:MAG: hypothetical protein LBT48_05400 [Prevotellaceae bacterium]|jgi:hypothetical protein|nr:hypothetical protein [Prevotellaceae bacterium]